MWAARPSQSPVTIRIQAIVTLAVCAMSSLTMAALQPVPAFAASGWLNRLNAWRASTNLPPLSENTTWDQGDYDHSLYMVKDDKVTHY